MRLTILFLICPLFVMAQSQKSKAPTFAMGNFTDDYGIKYSINDTLWIQHPNIKYHIISWNEAGKYLIAKNGSGHKSNENKYTRIDFVKLAGMEPFRWGFCLTNYKAESILEAENTAAADRQNPKKRCNGYPFSRMKVIDSD